jgi:aerobic carbon-monoxide dehydrogenase large subunit
VEVDLHTGLVRVLRHLVVEDCGAMVNPTIVEGQIAGGVAQGLATVLLERIAYDDTGQLRTATLLDYLAPTATDVPMIEIEHLASPPQGPVDFRGVGESGAIGAPAALSNAIENALAPFGVRVTRKHLPPDTLLSLITNATGVNTAR